MIIEDKPNRCIEPTPCRLKSAYNTSRSRCLGYVPEISRGMLKSSWELYVSCYCIYMCVYIYTLEDPLPAKHLEEQTGQTGTKTYDLWCRKGGGTGWLDIKATDLWCRKGGRTGWLDIKATDLWCRKGGGTGWQDSKANDLWCRKGGLTGWQDIKATDLWCKTCGGKRREAYMLLICGAGVAGH